MAINPEDRFPGRVAPSSPEYPYGAARNDTFPGDNTGTPQGEADLVNDTLGFQQAILSEAGISPTGTPEKVGASQYLEALKKRTPSTYSTVADLKTSAAIKAGNLARTTAYYDGWTATLVPEGGAFYYIATLQQIRDTLGDPSWIPDEYGDHTLNSGLVAKILFEGYTSPEQYGAKGDGSYDDSLHIVNYMKSVRKQRWTPGKTYVLNAATTSDNRAFRVYSDTEMLGYGAVIDLQGVTNNGFYCSDVDGTVFRTKIGGFRFIQTDPDTITSAITVEGFVSDMLVEDNVAVSLDQYFIGLGGANSGYNDLTVRNNKVFNLNPQADNEFSLCYEFFPQQSSTNLSFYGNFGEQVGWGGVFKIHTCENSFIHDNVFIRTSNVSNSQSQAVMLGGRVTNPTDRTYFHNNRIFEANSSLGALFMGNTSSRTFVQDNHIEGPGGIIWVGNSINESKICGNYIEGNIFSLSSAQNDIVDLTISGNKLSQINFQAPAGGNLPDSIDRLLVNDNDIRLGVRINTTGASSNVVIADNEISDVNSTCLLYADNIEFKDNHISVSSGWTAGSQVVVANGANYRQMSNTWDLKGLVSQTAWLNGSTGAQVVGETVENATTRVALDNGTGSDIFDNRLKLSGGSWAVV